MKKGGPGGLPFFACEIDVACFAGLPAPTGSPRASKPVESCGSGQAREEPDTYFTSTVIFCDTTLGLNGT